MHICNRRPIVELSAEFRVLHECELFMTEMQSDGSIFF